MLRTNTRLQLLGILLSSLLTSTNLVGCAISRPCTEGGDTQWQPLLLGDKHCSQKKARDGSLVNDGPYQVVDKNGKILLDGQFADGLKEGTWIQFDEKGHKIIERHFEAGVEKSVAMPSSERRR